MPSTQHLHTTLSHLKHPGTYVRMLFLDFRLAFNAIILSKMRSNWTWAWTSTFVVGIDFFTNWSQTIRMGTHHSSSLMIIIRTHLLFSLYRYDCTPTHSTETIIKFTDNTTIVGLIHSGDESTYRDEVCRLTDWCFTSEVIYWPLWPLWPLQMGSHDL